MITELLISGICSCFIKAYEIAKIFSVSGGYMKKLSYIIYIFLQCTWGFFQTFAGLIYFIISFKYPHAFYHGSVVTYRDKIGGVSLGMFIFVGEYGDKNKVAVHEFGHTIQSLILGPFYLPVIGVISGCWCSLPYFKKLRREKNVSYNSCFTESWANDLGKKFLSQPSTKDE